MFLAFEIFFALLLNVEQLGEKCLVPSVFILKLLFLDHARILKLKQHFLSRHQIVHRFGLILQLGVLFANDFLFFLFSLVFLRFKFVLGSSIQLLQLVLILGNRFSLLVDLTLEDPSDLKHVFFVERDVLGSLGNIFLKVEKAESPLLNEIVEVGDIVGLALLLLLNVLICH